MGLAERKDPYAAFRFKVEIEGLTVGGFTEITGLQAETEIEEYREGGVNGYAHKLAKSTKYPNLTLKHGISEADALWKWYRNTATGTIERKDIFINLVNYQGDTEISWYFPKAYPVKWTGPDLKSDANTIAVEAVEFVHQGFVKIRP